MKKLIIVFSLIAGSVVGQYNQQFIDRFCGYPNHHFPKGHAMAHYKQGIVNFPIKNTKTYNGRKETDKFTRYDSISRVTLEQFIFDRLNYYRKRYGVHELKWDERIRPATYHHVRYQRAIGKSKRSYKRGEYYTRPKMKSFKNKKSSWTQKFHKLYPEAKTLKHIEKVTGIPKKALSEVKKKGMGAYYSSGSRPGQTANSWAYARVYAYIMGGAAVRKIEQHITDKYKVKFQY